MSTRAKFCRFESKDLPESPLDTQRAFCLKSSKDQVTLIQKLSLA